MDDLGFRQRPVYEDEGAHNSRDFLAHRRRVRAGRGSGKIAAVVGAVWRWIRTPRTGKQWIRLGVKVISVIIVIGLIYGTILWFTLPNIDDPQTLFASESTVILDRNNTELYRLFSEEDRTYVPLTNISESIKKATIAIEDQRFFERGCFDVIGFARAVMSQAFPSIFVRSGGSTLTQQFAGNAMVGRQRSLTRKVRELMLACQLESHYNKDELLELYLNWIPYGQNAYGVEQASQRYFSKSASGVTLAESAVLAALPQLPSYYNPYGKHVRTTVTDDVLQDIISGDITDVDDIDDDDIAIGLLGANIGTGTTTIYVGGRTDQVLKNMEDQNMISTTEREQALADLQTITFARARENIRAAHFVLWVREQVEDMLGDLDPELLQEGGFTVKTTLDWKLQQAAEKAVTKYHENNVKLYNAHNAALVSLDPKTREILAYVGNADFNDEENEGKIDMARIARQPGSSFKPFVYALAFEKGYGPGSTIYDVETKIGDDTPQNFDGQFLGLLTMRRALAYSRNVPAAKTLYLAGGEDQVLAFADSLGVTTPLKTKEEAMQNTPDFGFGWPLALGAAETPLLEMVQGYAAFASGGMTAPIVSILEIKDRQGNILYQSKPEEPREVMDPRIAAEITSILSDVEARPANEFWRTQLSIPGVQTAAKTGTSNKCLERNAAGGCTLRRPEGTWTIGYTPGIVTGVWAGNARSESLGTKADGLGTASPIWRDYMIDAQKIAPPAQSNFTVPSNIATPLVSVLSGKMPSACTPVELRKADMFLEENIPDTEDSACALLKVDKVTGLLASPACPEDAVEEKAFFIPASEAPERWPLWEQAVQAWAKKEMEKWNASETHSGSQLPLPLAPTELCDPSLTPGRGETPTVRIVTPGEGDSVSYPSFEPRITIDSAAKITEVRFEIDGKPIRTITEGPFNQSIRVPRSISEDGMHTLTVTIVNEYFSEATDSVEFRFGAGGRLLERSVESGSGSLD